MSIMRETLSRREDGVVHELMDVPEQAERRVEELLGRRQELADELAVAEQELEFVVFSTCGVHDESQPVETYDGRLGVSKEFVAAHERPIGQLQWLTGLAQSPRFSGPTNSPGTVSGRRWGTGALISRSLFLTAGHCFDPVGRGGIRPIHNQVTIPAEEIATLMRVNFNFQRDGATGQMRPEVPFPVRRLREYRRNNLDYAIVELGPDASGRLPGDVFGFLRLAAADVTTPLAPLCIIQHPNQGEKKIEAGRMLGNSGGVITYNDIDTVGFASGAPILSVNGDRGEIVGVHVQGGCVPLGGANSGQSIGVIRAASTLIV